MTPGFPLLADLLGLDAALESADLAIAVAGRIELDPDQLAAVGFHAAGALTDRAGSPAEARRDAATLLRRETASHVQRWLCDQ